MKDILFCGPPPCPSRHLRPGPGAEAARVVPLLRRVVERVGVAQRGGGAPHARLLRVVEVLLRVSVFVVRLVLWPAGRAGGRRSGQYRSLPSSSRTHRKGLALTFLLPKGPSRRIASSSGTGAGREWERGAVEGRL